MRHLSPEFQCRVGSTGNDQPDCTQGKLSMANLRTLMMQIQSWTPRILQTCDANSEDFVDLKCQLHSAAQWILNLMTNLPRKDKSAIVQRKSVYSSMVLRSILATRLIPSYVCMKTVCSKVISILFPNFLDQPLEDLLQSKHLFPSDSSKHSMRLFLDSALLLWRRDEEEQHEFIRFGGADSSPQHGYNWLLSSNFFIDRKNIVHVFRCIQRMVEDSCACISDGLDREQSQQSKQDHLDVLSMVRREHDLPVALGHHAESTAHKCAAMLHKFAMRISMNDRREKLRRFTLSFFSFCSDMGVEIGIGEFKVADGDLEPLLPNWLIGGDMASDLPKDALNFSGERLSAAASFDLEPDIAPASAAVDVEALASEHVEDREPEPQDRDFHSSIFLPQAMRIPGSLHIINNALEQVTEKLSHWQDFLAQLKIFEALWCCGRLQRFVNFCLRPSVLTHKCDEILRRKLGSLYTKRWGEVVYFCIRLKGVLPILRSTWDERRFLFGIDGAERSGDEGDETQENLNGRSNFDPSLLTRTLKDSFFFAYLDMILALVSMTEDIAHWAEACSCHEDVILQHGFAENQGLQGQSRKKHRMTMKSGRVLSSLFSGKADVCPMRGKRLPELVAYGAEKMLLDLFICHRIPVCFAQASCEQ